VLAIKSLVKYQPGIKQEQKHIANINILTHNYKVLTNRYRVFMLAALGMIVSQVVLMKLSGGHSVLEWFMGAHCCLLALGIWYAEKQDDAVLHYVKVLYIIGFTMLVFGNVITESSSNKLIVVYSGEFDVKKIQEVLYVGSFIIMFYFYKLNVNVKKWLKSEMQDEEKNKVNPLEE